ncbi:heme ABC transporter ATP-binding protein [Salinisphaera orenii]|uniref:Hemin ABC transporter ATP-binding protein n=1 Tax=Salinisphaera orenii YIM 95161 TaxID=1051139 RepID=A0A423PJJ5_9GAMM|nr:heme ABC transporter ATP-binding protein [Salinisphaera halophila]ROO25775.1 hemin ABC transporter ATP-binding protein [Salinisphaera halophila YIM 95161]
MLEVADVDVARGGRTLLRGLSFHLAAGERLAVIGPNGAGKSSLLHTLIGDHAPARGDIRVGGRPLTALGDRERACRLALLPQASTLDFPFTVDEVVALGRTPHASGAVADRAVIEAVCAATDIDHLRRRLYPRLSGGEKQRVQLARVLAQIWRPEDAGERLLLLDEPVAALDIGHQALVMDRIAAFAAGGAAVVVVLHDISLAARHADRMLALRDGAAVAQGVPSDVVTVDTMRRLFDADACVMTHPRTHTPVVLHG